MKTIDRQGKKSMPHESLTPARKRARQRVNSVLDTLHHGHDERLEHFEQAEHRGAEEQAQDIAGVAQQFHPRINKDLADGEPQRRVVKDLHNNAGSIQSVD